MFNTIIAGIMSIIGVPFCGTSQMFMRGIGALAFCEYDLNNTRGVQNLLFSFQLDGRRIVR
jgi:hypothetical protein